MSDIVFGVHSVEMLLNKNPERVLELWIAENKINNLAKIVNLAKSLGLNIQVVKVQTLAQISQNALHQGVLAKVRAVAEKTENDLWQIVENTKDPLVLILDGITDPHNLGACLRSADGAGACAVVIAKDRSVKLTATASKVASGAVQTVPLIAVTNLTRCIKTLQEKHNFWVFGTTDKAKKTIFQADFKGATALVLGSEGDGIRRLVSEQCDELLSIPMQGAVSSLNVSVAAGVCMFEVLRQRLN